MVASNRKNSPFNISLSSWRHGVVNYVTEICSIWSHIEGILSLIIFYFFPFFIIDTVPIVSFKAYAGYSCPKHFIMFLFMQAPRAKLCFFRRMIQMQLISWLPLALVLLLTVATYVVCSWKMSQLTNLVVWHGSSLVLLTLTAFSMMKSSLTTFSSIQTISGFVFFKLNHRLSFYPNDITENATI